MLVIADIGRLSGVLDFHCILINMELIHDNGSISALVSDKQNTENVPNIFYEYPREPIQ